MPGPEVCVPAAPFGPGKGKSFCSPWPPPVPERPDSEKAIRGSPVFPAAPAPAPGHDGGTTPALGGGAEPVLVPPVPAAEETRSGARPSGASRAFKRSLRLSGPRAPRIVPVPVPVPVPFPVPVRPASIGPSPTVGPGSPVPARTPAGITEATPPTVPVLDSSAFPGPDPGTGLARIADCAVTGTLAPSQDAPF
jgi:hypothetical protein